MSLIKSSLPQTTSELLMQIILTSGIKNTE
nr:MAG TPA: hypothetical protein [Caudoviricetes sp.]DAW30931.1 MAG TPA: hypothetical protein [Caudoviricetes sp.]